MQPVFHNNTSRFMYFPQQRHVYLMKKSLQRPPTQEEEYNQFFRHLSVEFLVRLIHFIHFIHPYINPLPIYFDICIKFTFKQ